MSGRRSRWPRYMRRRKFGPPDGAWYCCGGRLMRSMPDPDASDAVQLHICPRCGTAIRARGAELLETLQSQVRSAPASMAGCQLTLFDLSTDGRLR